MSHFLSWHIGTGFILETWIILELTNVSHKFNKHWEWRKWYVMFLLVVYSVSRPLLLYRMWKFIYNWEDSRWSIEVSQQRWGVCVVFDGFDFTQNITQLVKLTVLLSLFVSFGTLASFCLRANSTISGDPCLLVNRSQILDNPFLGSPKFAVLMLFACLDYSGPKNLISKSISSSVETCSSCIMLWNVAFHAANDSGLSL